MTGINLAKTTSLALSLLAVSCFVAEIDALLCHHYHKFYEEGKRREIIPDACQASGDNPHCVKVVYWDDNPDLKRGHSWGCDKVDCLTSNIAAFGWDEDGCRHVAGYGSQGKICCCNDRDRCNAAARPGPDTKTAIITIFGAVLLARLAVWLITFER